MEKYHQPRDPHSVYKFGEDITRAYHSVHKNNHMLYQILFIDNSPISIRGQKIIVSGVRDGDLTDKANEKPEHFVLKNAPGGQLFVDPHGAQNISTAAGTQIHLRDSGTVTSDQEEGPDTSFVHVMNDHKSMKRQVPRIGTVLFMAADLYGHGEPPSYHHDLESFFLTFALVCATFGPWDDMHNRGRKFLKELKEIGRPKDIRYGDRLRLQASIYMNLARDLSGPYSHVFKECIVPRLVLSAHAGHGAVAPFFGFIFLHLLGETVVMELDKELEDLGQQKNLVTMLATE